MQACDVKTAPAAGCGPSSPQGLSLVIRLVSDRFGYVPNNSISYSPKFNAITRPQRDRPIKAPIRASKRNAYSCIGKYGNNCARIGCSGNSGLGILSRQTFWQTGNFGLVAVSCPDESLVAVLWFVRTGIYLNLVAVLLLLVASTGLYIYLGRQLRKAASDAVLRSRPDAAEVKSQSDTFSAPDSQPTPAKETIKIV